MAIKPAAGSSRGPTGHTWSDLGLALTLVYPSIAIFRIPGWSFAAAYVLSAVVALWVLKRWVIPAVHPRVSEAAATWLLIGVLVALTAVHLWVHPRIDTAGFHVAGVWVGPSDGDNAIDDALSRLLAGRYPYHVRTFLDNPVTPMPGALLAAVPFHLLGATTLQNLFWLGVFALLLTRLGGDRKTTTLLVGTALILSPALLYHLMQGMDYIANNIYVLAALVGVLHFARQGRLGAAILLALVFGVALSSRLNYLVIAPLVLLPLQRDHGTGFAALAALAMATGFLGVMLPFYLYDPAGFSPLHTAAIAPGIPGVPFSHLTAPALAGLLAIALGRRADGGQVDRVMVHCFLVQLVLMAGSLVLTAADGGIDVRFAHFGVLFMFFGLFAWGPDWVREALAGAAERGRALSPPR